MPKSGNAHTNRKSRFQAWKAQDDKQDGKAKRRALANPPGTTSDTKSKFGKRNAHLCAARVSNVEEERRSHVSKANEIAPLTRRELAMFE